MLTQNTVEVLIIGGSYAGLSAGMALGRSLRNVLIIDSGKPCNKQTPHSHNFITQDGQTPEAIAAKARSQVLAYPTVQIIHDKAVQANRKADRFEITTVEGKIIYTKKLLIATGITDLMPDIPGFAECWGISVLHCPYCHGYEVNNKKLGILGNGNSGYDFVKLLYNWSKQLVLFTNGRSTLTPEQQLKLQQYQIPVVETVIQRVAHAKGYLTGLIMADGRPYTLDAIFARVPFVQHTDLALQLGCAHTEAGYITTDEYGRTTVPGVYAAGDNTTLMRSVAMAIASGNKAGAVLNKEMIDEAF
jgi:thioredoxin reductase